MGVPIKYNSDGSIEHHKARLVVLGNRQFEGINYIKTFALVDKMVFAKVFLAVISIRNWELHKMDARNAFLHDDLEEEVFMSISHGFSISGSNKVCRLASHYMVFNKLLEIGSLNLHQLQASRVLTIIRILFIILVCSIRDSPSCSHLFR